MSKLLLFGGKGGVGKTTIAAATAIWAADHGYKTLIVSSDPAHSTSDSFEQEIRNEPTPIQGIDGLFALEINPEEELEEFLPDFYSKIERPLKLMGIEELNFTQDDLLFPGLDEALAFDKLLTYVESPFYDLIVFDTAPTGHTLRFLSLPELLDSWLVKVLKFKVQISRLKNLILGKHDTSLDDMQKLKNRVEHIRRVLRNREIASFTLVTIPEQLGILESKRALKQIEAYNIPVKGIIVNLVFPQDSRCAFCAARRKVQSRYIKQARKLARDKDLEIALLEIQEKEVKGITMLRSVAKKLYEKEEIHLNLTKTMTITEHEDRIEVIIQLPSTISREIDLRTDGKDLILDINGIVNRVTMPRNVEDLPVSARFEEDTLNVTITKEKVKKRKK